jgi:hypothetical protein
MLHKIDYVKELYGANEYALKLVEHRFSGIKFVLGKVSFNEDNFTLKYDYDIIEHDRVLSAEEKEEFEHVVGELIVQLITDGVQKNDLIYTGGVDED